MTRIDLADASVLAPYSAATLFETGLAPALPVRIRSVAGPTSCVGRALTVSTASGHNLWLHRAVYLAEPGDVLVVNVGAYAEFGYWGDILSTAAIERGLAGLVIDGCARDKAEIDSLGFPVFARGLCVRGTGKDTSIGGVGSPVRLGPTTISTGDVVVADADGIVVISPENIAEARSRAAARDENENTVAERLKAGETTLEIYGWGP